LLWGKSLILLESPSAHDNGADFLTGSRERSEIFWRHPVDVTVCFGSHPICGNGGVENYSHALVL